MKSFIKPIVLIAAVAATSFSYASGKHDFRYTAVPVREDKTIVHENSFSVEVLEPGVDKRIRLIIKNPSRKNLYVSLKGPDGFAIDDFFTGKHASELSKVYNFSIAEEGLYSIEVRSGNEKIKKEIKLEHVNVPTIQKLTVQ